MELKTFDLNLLVVFEAVLRERGVTKAGEKLGLSQPAMSHALNRLRWMLKDQLFVRTPEGMMPTPRAEYLAEPICRALFDLQRTLDPEDFLPEEADRRFTIAANNYAASVLAGPIFAECRAVAPNVRLDLRPSGTLNVPELLDRGELDVALVGQQAQVGRFSSQLLMEDEFVAVMRRGHPMARQRLVLETFASLPHLVISSSGDDLGFVDTELAACGLTRSVMVEAPYLSAGSILTQSDMVTVMGRQIAENFRRAFAIELMPLPIPSGPLGSVMVWHSRFDDHPGHQWLRATIISVAGQFGPSPARATSPKSQSGSLL
jgi:DNA-binding transcriptional LysR family regulator